MIKPIAYLINDREHCTGIHSVQSMKDVGLTEKTMQDRWGDALVPLYAIPEGYALVPIEAPIEAVAEMGFLGDVDLAIGHALISQELSETYTKTIKAVMIKAGGVK